MCGITGIFNISSQKLSSECELMTEAIQYRGPDDSGVWFSKEDHIAMGHRRLSIIDLSNDGHQPMESKNGRYIIVYNGEIYNFAKLRLSLKKDGQKFNGTSDTEVLLCAIDQWGIEITLSKIEGMYSFAVWDTYTKTLILVRDRFGEKPLYYGMVGERFVFGSELAAIRAPFGPELKIDRNALKQYMRFAYVPSPMSIYQGINKLEAGNYLSVSYCEVSKNFEIINKSYWDASSLRKNVRKQTGISSLNDEVQKIDRLLNSSVEKMSISDVPIGAFLSGGIDSSMIVALMQKQSSKKIQTFTIGFNEAEYNEAKHAKVVAEYIGTDHHELYVTPRDLLEVVGIIPKIYSEPFADSSQIPTYLVSKFAAERVKVALSGDGGDELFAGYNRYTFGNKILKIGNFVPNFIKNAGSNAITSVSTGTWDKMGSYLSHLNDSLDTRTGDKLHKLAVILNSSDSSQMYENLVSLWHPSEGLVLDAEVKEKPRYSVNQVSKESGHIEFMQYADLITYLPDDILVKVDRAAMSNSLETRAPFLDLDLVNYAWSLPMSHKIRGMQGKIILRENLYRYVPKDLIDRPKMGFGIPIDKWLRNELRDWAEELLDPKIIKTQGYFNNEVLQKKWSEHLTGQRNWHHHIWCVLMFQLWLKSL
ncbi:asparagine synthase (glutamine-hydrolyzing) [Amylibacter sp.]|nr:asparagine synthase (glutamine-hydrolyzing) [Amylibacter sp.]